MNLTSFRKLILLQPKDKKFLSESLFVRNQTRFIGENCFRSHYIKIQMTSSEFVTRAYLIRLLHLVRGLIKLLFKQS